MLRGITIYCTRWRVRFVRRVLDSLSTEFRFGYEEHGGWFRWEFDVIGPELELTILTDSLLQLNLGIRIGE